jgi:hypothetical protein
MTAYVTLNMLCNHKMNRLSFLFKNEPKTFLGRWNVDYCQQTLHTKIMLANEDNCGTCGSTMISTRIHQQSKWLKNREYKTNVDSFRKYNEYINAAVRSRKFPEKDNDLEKQIDYYICMH